MRKSILPAIFLAAISLASCHSHNDHADEHNHTEAAGKDNHDENESHDGEIHFTQAQAKAAKLTIETLQPQSFRSVLRTSGQIQALQGDEQTIVATSSGILNLTNGSFTEGAAVKQGESIASISARTLQDGDPVTKAKLAFETAEKEFRRAEKLVVDKIISDKEYNQIRMQYETAKAAYEGQATNLTAKGVKVTSPISGYIKSRLASQGEYVTVGQPIAVVAQNRRLQLRADVSERDFQYLHGIQTANFRTSYDNTVHRLQELNGKLLSYGKAATGGASFIPVTFEFDNIGNLVPGAFAQVYLLSAPRQGVLSIPTSSLTEENGLFFVYLYIGEEIYKKQEVKLGQNDGTRVEITEGLKSGDRVVTTGAYQVKLASASASIPAHSHSH